MDAMLASDDIGKLAAAARSEIGRVVLGLNEPVEHLLAALLAGGHVLLEGPPGTAKTLLVRVLARLFTCSFKRIQFTPDLVPADVIGTSIFDPGRQAFEFRPGPVFAEFLLGDEINRAPAKTQSALLESMQERQVTVDGVTHMLPPVFTVFATQNPVEQEGTYPLPEAQLDRFMMKILIDYPAEADEVAVLRTHQQSPRVENLDRFALTPIGGAQHLLAAQAAIRSQGIREELLSYVVRVIRATRDNLKVEVGASPRAALMLLMASKAQAALHGRGHVLPDDVKAMALPVLRHRLVLKPGAEIDGFSTDEVLKDILARVEVPR
jgi:MoxR-like ATPase